MRHKSAFAAIVFTSAIWGGNPMAQTLQCACQQVLICGADQCEPMPFDACAETEIALSLEEPAIRLCSADNCLEGPAQRTDISETALALSGEYGSEGEPELASTRVQAVLDQDTWIGTIQTSDEQAVIQLAMICQPPE